MLRNNASYYRIKFCNIRSAYEKQNTFTDEHSSAIGLTFFLAHQVKEITTGQEFVNAQ
jgi:hypothetical protein